MRSELLTVQVPRNFPFFYSSPSGTRVDPDHSGIKLRKLVIICEDDPDLLRVYTLALRSKYDIVGAKNGAECLRKYAQIKREGGQVDILLLDFKLPDMTGDEVAVKLRNLNGTSVILISAYEIENQLIESLRSSGSITTFLKKPVSIKALGMALDNALSA